MDDIQSEVRLFEVHVEEIRGSGRGRPVVRLVFTVSPVSKRIETRQAARLSGPLLSYHRRDDRRHAKAELPTNLAVGRALTATRFSETQLSDGWRVALDRAKDAPNGHVGPALQGGVLLSTLQRDGADAAFWVWAEACEIEGIKPDVLRSPAKPVPAAAPDAAAPVPEPGYSAEGGENRRALNKAYAIRRSQDLVDMIDGWSPAPDEETRRSIRFRFSDAVIDTYCHRDAIPWAWLLMDDTDEDVRTAAGRLRAALQVLLRSTSSHRRASLRNLAAAVEGWDADRLARTVRAICAHGPESRDSARHPAPAKIPPPVRRHRRPPRRSARWSTTVLSRRARRREGDRLSKRGAIANC